MSHHNDSNVVLYIPLNRESALYLLSYCTIYPESFLGSTGVYINEKIPLLKNGLRSSEFDTITKGVPARFPLLVELEIPTTPKIAWGRDPKELRRAIPLKSIKAIHFRSEEELDDFLSRPVRGVSFNWFPSQVSPKLFNQKGKSRLLNVHHLELEHTHVALANSIAGAVLLTVDSPEEDRARHDMATSLLGLSTKYPSVHNLYTFTFDAIVNGGQPTEPKVAIAAIRTAYQAKYIKTHEPSVFFDRFCEQITNSKLDGIDSRTISKWNTIAHEYADSLRDVDEASFADNGNIPLRSALLYFWKQNNESIRSFKQTYPYIGKEVLALASFFAGIGTGLNKIPSKVKEPHIDWISEIACHTYNAIDGDKTIVAKLNKEPRDGLSHFESLVTREGNKITSIIKSAPSSIYRVLDWAIENNIESEWDYHDEKLTIFSKKFDVYITIESLQSSIGPVLALRSSPISTKPTKSDLIDLLQDSAKLGTAYRYTFSKQDGVCLAADLTESTLDKEEINISVGQIFETLEFYASN